MADSKPREGAGGLRAVALAVVGGLLLAGASAGDWVLTERADQVGGIALSEVVRSQGYDLAPLALPFGLLAAVLAVPLAMLRGTARRLVGSVLVALGGAACLTVVSGYLRARGIEGTLSALPGLAFAGAVAVAAAGLFALRRPRPPRALGARYDLEAREADDEWELASEDEPRRER